MRRFIDIGANLTDAMYTGVYNGSLKHEADLIAVLKRSWESGLSKIIVTGGSLSESQRALSLVKNDDRMYVTVGCHPTRCSEFENGTTPEEYYQNLMQTALQGGKKVVAIGECGLDYDRLQFCSRDIQLKYFEKQIRLSIELNLPLFLHCRNAAEDMKQILNKFSGLRGVVHSFDGTPEQAKSFIEMGYYIGLNGCSLKSPDNLETVKSLPDDRILIETDCPWCEIRPTHAGYKFIKSENILQSVKKEKWSSNMAVKGRNEPANIRQVMDVISAVRNSEDLSEKIYENTLELFFPQA